MLPTHHWLDAQRIRLYYGACDADLVSRVEYVELDADRPTVALARPVRVLDVGAPGHFDDNGVLPGCVVSQDGALHLLYMGFQKQTKVPYTILTGLATSRDGGSTFERAITTPVLERSFAEPFFRTAPCVLSSPAGLRLWYIGGGGWIPDGKRLLPTYSLRTLTSTDVRTWPASGEVCLAPIGSEIGFGRPSVLHEGGRYRMWYSIRRRTGYLLGYAESSDGERWQRQDGELDLGPPIAGFDDEMTCYSAVVRHDRNLLMFYNGNGYGRAGIGVAVLEPDSAPGPAW